MDNSRADALLERVESYVDQKLAKYDELVAAEERSAANFNRPPLPGVNVDPTGRKAEAFSLGKALQLAAGAYTPDSPGYGYTNDVLKELANGADRDDPVFGAMNTKSLNAATDSAGGFLVPTEVASEILDDLHDRLIVDKLGFRNLRGLVGDLAFPKNESGTSTEWLDTETFEVGTESSSTVASLSLTPHPVASFTLASWRMMRGPSIVVETWVKQEISRELRLEIDRAVFTGSGSNGEPLGLWTIPGTSTVDFSSATFTTATSNFPTKLRSMFQTLRASNADLDDGKIAFVGEPSAVEGIEAVRDADGRYVLMAPDAPIARNVWGTPVHSKSSIANTADTTDLRFALGDWSQAIYGEWGQMALETSNSHNNSFLQGAIWIRGIVGVDVVYPNPDAFVLAADYDAADLP